MIQEIVKIVSDHLKSKKLKFTIIDEDETPFFEIYVGSSIACIQLEYSESTDIFQAELSASYFIRTSEFSSDYFYNDMCFEDFTNIGQVLIDEVVDPLLLDANKFTKLIVLIENKVNQIKNLCKENEIDHEEFITINFDF